MPEVSLVRRNSWSFGKGLNDLKDDLSTLRHLWFSQLSKKKSADHATRLEQFYGPQAAACAWRGGPSIASGGGFSRPTALDWQCGEL